MNEKKAKELLENGKVGNFTDWSTCNECYLIKAEAFDKALACLDEPCPPKPEGVPIGEWDEQGIIRTPFDTYPRTTHRKPKPEQCEQCGNYYRPLGPACPYCANSPLKPKPEQCGNEMMQDILNGKRGYNEGQFGRTTFVGGHSGSTPEAKPEPSGEVLENIDQHIKRIEQEKAEAYARIEQLEADKEKIFWMLSNAKNRGYCVIKKGRAFKCPLDKIYDYVLKGGKDASDEKR